MTPLSKKARIDQLYSLTLDAEMDQSSIPVEQSTRLPINRSQSAPALLQPLLHRRESDSFRKSTAPPALPTNVTTTRSRLLSAVARQDTQSISDMEKAEVMALFPDSINADRLQYDVFTDAAMLHRQLAHEKKIELNAADYEKIRPFGDKSVPAKELDAHSSAITVERDEAGQIFTMLTKGRFTLPAGWEFEDKIIRLPNDVMKIKTTLTGPDGKSGMIQRSFDGQTLYLDKAYKSTLPSRLEGLQDFDKPVALINYMTARACKIIGVTSSNLKQIKVNRLQHRAALTHLDWLSRRYPERKLCELIDHTTWARSYIQGTSTTFGLDLVPVPIIHLEGSDQWKTGHPGARHRDWSYLGNETKRLNIEHITGIKIAKLDDPDRNWVDEMNAAINQYKKIKCQNFTPEQADRITCEVDRQIQTKISAIENEAAALRQRYDMPIGSTPRYLNFDVTYRTKPVV